MLRLLTRTGAYLTVAVFLIGLAATVSADNPATVLYRGGGKGPVIFDHRQHAAKGYGCRDCHTDFAGTGKQLFPTRKQGLIDRAVHDRDEGCFACHNNTVASNDCETCHSLRR
jgi:c(7)-type cytochrome triheme protein